MSDNGSGPILDERITKRLAEPRAELQAGQNLFAQRQTEQAQLQQAILRIAGAIQVLEELSRPVEKAETDDG